LVFYVGSQIGSQVTFQWQVPPPGVPVIQLDIDADVLKRYHPKKHTLLGDAKMTLRRMIEVCGGGTASLRQPWVSRVQQLAQAWQDEFAPHLHSDAIPIRPERLCHELSRNLPPGAIVVSDTGHAGMWTGGMLDLTKPNQSYIRAAGSLGWGVPAALGAKLAAPDRPVLLFIGDGGFMYHVAELETAARCNINAVFLVNNNQGFSQVIVECQNASQGKLEGRHGELWQFAPVDLVALAETMGCKGIRVTRPGDLPGAIAQAFAANRPCVVDVQTDVEIVAPLASADRHK
jgi:acetolactate synthase-1/2/3 large subunit